VVTYTMLAKLQIRLLTALGLERRIKDVTTPGQITITLGQWPAHDHSRVAQAN
jgi:hypothetical protein